VQSFKKTRDENVMVLTMLAAAKGSRAAQWSKPAQEGEAIQLLKRISKAIQNAVLEPKPGNVSIKVYWYEFVVPVGNELNHMLSDVCDTPNKLEFSQGTNSTESLLGGAYRPGDDRPPVKNTLWEEYSPDALNKYVFSGVKEVFSNVLKKTSRKTQLYASTILWLTWWMRWVDERETRARESQESSRAREIYNHLKSVDEEWGWFVYESRAFKDPELVGYQGEVCAKRDCEASHPPASQPPHRVPPQVPPRPSLAPAPRPSRAPAPGAVPAPPSPFRAPTGRRRSRPY